MTDCMVPEGEQTRPDIEAGCGGLKPRQAVLSARVMASLRRIATKRSFDATLKLRVCRQSAAGSIAEHVV